MDNEHHLAAIRNLLERGRNLALNGVLSYEAYEAQTRSCLDHLDKIEQAQSTPVEDCIAMARRGGPTSSRPVLTPIDGGRA